MPTRWAATAETSRQCLGGGAWRYVCAAHIKHVRDLRHAEVCRLGRAVACAITSHGRVMSHHLQQVMLKTCCRARMGRADWRAHFALATPWLCRSKAARRSGSPRISQASCSSAYPAASPDPMNNVQHSWGLLRVLLRAAAGAALLCVRVRRLQSSPCRPESVLASVLECALPARETDRLCRGEAARPAGGTSV